jgi:hypothetical protein
MGLYKFEFEFEFAWALRHKPARIAVFADRGAATRRPGAEKPRTYETYYSNRRDFKKREKIKSEKSPAAMYQDSYQKTQRGDLSACPKGAFQVEFWQN